MANAFKLLPSLEKLQPMHPTSLIIVGSLHAFKTAAQFLSALAEKFQFRRKTRPARWSILAWGLWDGLRTGVLETVRWISKSL